MYESLMFHINFIIHHGQKTSNTARMLVSFMAVLQIAYGWIFHGLTGQNFFIHCQVTKK